MWPRMPGSNSSVKLRFQIVEIDGATVLLVTGELDITATAQMSDALTTGCSLARDRLVVDVSGLAFIDIAGLRVLLSAHSRLLGQGRTGIVVRGASGCARRVFELTGFASLLDDSPPVVVQEQGRELENGRQHAGLSLKALFVSYFALGGAADFAEMVAHLGGNAEVLDIHQRDVAAHALNERLADLGCTEHLLSVRSRPSRIRDGARMSGEQIQDERAWDADKRDFVATRRDEIAAERDVVATARDATADEREQLADKREAELEDRERRTEELDISPGHSAGEQSRRVAERADGVAQRQLARGERYQRRADRDTATGAREGAAKQRLAGIPPTGLAMAFAEIARYLYEADNFEDVLTRIVETAVSAVSDCDMASITVREGVETFRTLASTHSAAIAVDQAQYEVREGPCLDAVETAIVHAPSFPDPRWPSLAGRPVDSGVGAIVSYRLAAPGRIADDFVAGSLNAYAGTSQAFGDEAQEIGLILAAHASVGIQAVREREAFEQLGRQLHEALS